VADLDSLATLPERERRCGLGEMAKYHFLTGDDLLAMPLTERVARCVAIKAAVVGDDEREAISSDNLRGRATLNYGHTLAHALETAGDHALAHGEAVAIGLVYAAEVARALGRIDADRVAEHRRVVGDAYGLGTDLPAGCHREQLIELMARDKKALDGLTFVLDGPSGVEVVVGVPRSVLHDAFDAMGAP
jgi:5-deoxy-5-amino-3-dehydroquinate synthase